MFVYLRITKYILVVMVQLVQRNLCFQEGPKIGVHTIRIPTAWFGLLLHEAFQFKVTNSVSMEPLLTFDPWCPSVSSGSKLSRYARWTSDTYITLSKHHHHKNLISLVNQTWSHLTLDPGTPGCPFSPGAQSYPFKYRLSEARRDKSKSLLSFSQWLWSICINKTLTCFPRPPFSPCAPWLPLLPSAPLGPLRPGGPMFPLSP